MDMYLSSSVMMIRHIFQERKEILIFGLMRHFIVKSFVNAPSCSFDPKRPLAFLIMMNG